MSPRVFLLKPKVKIGGNTLGTYNVPSVTVTSQVYIGLWTIKLMKDPLEK